jgi:hypothetical protein
MAMYVKNYDIVDNKSAKSDVWADFGLKRMKLDGAIEQEKAITQYPIRIGSYCDTAMPYCNILQYDFCRRYSPLL